MDPASSEFYNKEASRVGLRSEGSLPYLREMVATTRNGREVPNHVSIEDGLAEEDWDSSEILTQRLSRRLVGDDLFVTNTQRLKGIEVHAGSLLIRSARLVP